MLAPVNDWLHPVARQPRNSASRPACQGSEEGTLDKPESPPGRPEVSQLSILFSEVFHDRCVV